MRIGIMLRSIDEKGGIGVYTRYITQELLEIDDQNEYVLFYRNKGNLGRFEKYKKATERVISAPNKAVWDQVMIPYACWKEKIDVLFHPKFTVPLLVTCKAVMVLHGAGWFLAEHQNYWNNLDRKYIRLMMPVYCKKASAVISVSQITTDAFNQLFNLPEGKVRTVYFAPGKQFKRIEDDNVLQKIRTKYDLPDKFILTVTGYDRGPRKNIKGILEAYKIHYGETPHKLVIAGKDCYRFKEDFGISDQGYGGDIVFPGWVDQKDLPAFYSLADLFLYPSMVEAFPIPVTEALACGTPIVTSNANGLKEIAGDAALFIDPHKPEEIAHAMYRVLSDSAFQSDLSSKGLQRAQMFNWRKCATETLGIIEAL
jgi:glycosyltransferase involved in cell wall biosynthesis